MHSTGQALYKAQQRIANHGLSQNNEQEQNDQAWSFCVERYKAC